MPGMNTTRSLFKNKEENQDSWLQLVDIDLENVKMVVIIHSRGDPSHEQLTQNRYIWQVVLNHTMSL